MLLRNLPKIAESRDWKPHVSNSKIYSLYVTFIPIMLRKEPNLKMGKGLNRYFSKEDMQMSNKPMKRCLTFLGIREMQIKTTMRYCFTSTRMTITKKTDNNKC